MSDLGKLFRLSITGPKPLENFTSTALVIGSPVSSRTRHAKLDSTVEEYWVCFNSLRVAIVADQKESDTGPASVEGLQAANTELRLEVDRFRTENDRLKVENFGLRGEAEELRARIDKDLESELAEL